MKFQLVLTASWLYPGSNNIQYSPPSPPTLGKGLHPSKEEGGIGRPPGGDTGLAWRCEGGVFLTKEEEGKRKGGEGKRGDIIFFGGGLVG